MDGGCQPCKIFAKPWDELASYPVTVKGIAAI